MPRCQSHTPAWGQLWVHYGSSTRCVGLFPRSLTQSAQVAGILTGAFHQAYKDLGGLSGGLLYTSAGPYYLTSNVGNSNANGIELGLRGTFGKNYRWGVNERAEWQPHSLCHRGRRGLRAVFAFHLDCMDPTRVREGSRDLHEIASREFMGAGLNPQAFVFVAVTLCFPSQLGCGNLRDSGQPTCCPG